MIPPARKRCPGPLCGVPCEGFHAGSTPRFLVFMGVRWAPCGKDHRPLLSSCGVFPETFTDLRGSPSCGRTACWVWFQTSGLSLSYLLSQLRSLDSSEHTPFLSCTDTLHVQTPRRFSGLQVVLRSFLNCLERKVFWSKQLGCPHVTWLPVVPCFCQLRLL